MLGFPFGLEKSGHTFARRTLRRGERIGRRGWRAPGCRPRRSPSAGPAQRPRPRLPLPAAPLCHPPPRSLRAVLKNLYSKLYGKCIVLGALAANEGKERLQTSCQQRLPQLLPMLGLTRHKQYPTDLWAVLSGPLQQRIHKQRAQMDI